MLVFVAVCKTGGLRTSSDERLLNSPLVWALFTLPVAKVIDFGDVVVLNSLF